MRNFDKQPKIYSGLCIGGPDDGVQRSSTVSVIRVSEQTGQMAMDYTNPDVPADTCVKVHVYRHQPIYFPHGDTVYLWLHDSIPDLHAALVDIFDVYAKAARKK